MARPLSENKLCEKLGLPADRIRKLRLQKGIGKKESQQGVSLGLAMEDGFNILLRWEMRKHGASMLDVREKPERDIDFNAVGKEYDYLFRHSKYVKGAEHLKMGEWDTSKTLPVIEEDELSLMTINLVAIKETIKRVFSK